MSNVDDNVVPVLYALMALEQNSSTSELAVGAQNRSMPQANTETPDWFAAATESVDLLAMAPELREMPEDSSDAEGLDIIGFYAPEMSKVREARPAHAEPEVVDVAESVDVDDADAAVESVASEPEPTAKPVAEVETAPEPAPVPEPEPVASDVAPPPAPEPAPEIVEEVEVAEEVVEEPVPAAAAAAVASPGPLPPAAPKPASKGRQPSQFDLLKELGDLSE
ncbi:MAG: hypothetical protein L7U42_06520 [Candidatus Nanopelagicales bacterium]|nr:hypothetical protein [Candidatus Nanopelagicales bacterium]